MTGPLDLRVLSFVCCTLAGLPYQVQEEPLFILDYVNRQVGGGAPGHFSFVFVCSDHL